MKIAFICNSLIPIDNFTLERRPLGGTETGIIRLAQELDKLGHEVTVFTADSNPAPSTPRYLPSNLLFSVGRFDVMVAVQDWRVVFTNLPTDKIFFLTGDGPEQFSNYGLGDRRVSERLAGILMVSNYQLSQLCKQSGFPESKAHIIGNGVHLDYYQSFNQNKKKRLIYSSAPYRGLKYAVQIFKLLKKQLPELEFHVFSSMSLYDRELAYQGLHQREAQELQRTAQQVEGLIWHGAVRQEILARQYQEASVFFYPCTVPETCCISALEAQAAGCLSISTNIGALKESISEYGMILDCDFEKSKFIDDFAEATLDLLADDQQKKQLAMRAFENAHCKLGWNKVAERFLNLV